MDRRRVPPQLINQTARAVNQNCLYFWERYLQSTFVAGIPFKVVPLLWICYFLCSLPTDSGIGFDEWTCFLDRVCFTTVICCGLRHISLLSLERINYMSIGKITYWLLFDGCNPCRVSKVLISIVTDINFLRAFCWVLFTRCWSKSWNPWKL